MKKCYREYRRMVESEGGHILSFAQGKRHIRVTIEFSDGQTVVQGIATTPSDGNWVDKTRQDLKRIKRGQYANH